jgi:hypothetical protein
MKGNFKTIGSTFEGLTLTAFVVSEEVFASVFTAVT